MANKRPAVSVENLGCKINRVESDEMEQALAAAGFELVDSSKAQLIVINTCAVTGEAEAKTRKSIRKALKQPLEPFVVVTGCAVILHEAAYRELGTRVITTTDKNAVAFIAQDLLAASLACAGEDEASSLTPAQSYLEALKRRRLNIKVQDGCDYRCTFCIVWKARGKARSISAPEVLKRVNDACEAGFHEIILTGINLGRYRDHDHGIRSLGGLVSYLLTHTTIARIRLSSIEPQDITDELLACFAAYDERLCTHLHIPLQSGSSAVLKAMNRGYTAERYYEMIERVYAHVPKMALSTDIIAGFPGETDADFIQTQELCALARFNKMHVFRFSARPDTPAYDMDQVDTSLILERARLLRDQSYRQHQADATSRIGDIEQVLIERDSIGTSSSYHRVLVQDESGIKLPAGELVRVQFDEVDSAGLIFAHPISS